MHTRIGAMAIVSLTLSLLTSSAHADTPLTLPELLTRNRDYRATWTAMMSGIRASDREVGYIKTLTGPSDFILATSVEGQVILVGNLCQPRNCNANTLVVVIDPDTSQIYAVQRRRVDVPTRYRFFGRPDARMRSILLRQAELSDLPREERLKRLGPGSF